MDISGLTTFFTAILDAAVKIAALVAAVSLAAAGFMYFGVVGHNQRAMEAAQTGVRGGVPRPRLCLGRQGADQPRRGCRRPAHVEVEGSHCMSEQSPVVYSVPTHLREREPFAFGRTLGEVAKLVVVGFVAARLVGSDGLPAALRLPAAVVVLAGRGHLGAGAHSTSTAGWLARARLPVWRDAASARLAARWLRA